MKKSVKIQTKKMVFAALMVALSVVIGMFCKSYLTFGAIRVTFDNLPVLLAAVLLGPVYGGVVGAAADLITAPISGSVNPFITVGAASVGIVSGLIWKYAFKKKNYISVLSSVMSAHVVGSMVIKSFALWHFYGYAWQLLLPRIPLYLVIGLVESYIIYICMKNKRISSAFGSKGV